MYWRRILLIIFLIIFLIISNKVISQFDSVYSEARKYFSTDINKSEQLIYKALSFASIEEKNKAFVFLGILYKQKSDFEKSREYLNKALTNSLLTNDTLYIAKSFTNLGNLYLNQSKYDSATYYQLKSIQTKEHLKVSNVELAKCYFNLSNIFFETEDYSNYNLYLEKAHENYYFANDSIGMFLSHNSKGAYYDRIGQYDSSIFSYKNSKVFLSENDLYNFAMLYGNIGASYQSLNQIDSAEFYTKKALDLSIEIRDGRGIVANKTNLAGILKINKKEKEALELYKEALSLADSLGLLDDKAEILQNLSLVNASLGNYSEAFSYFQEYALIKDSIRNEEQIRAVQDAREKYETDLKEEKIKLQGVELEQEKLEKQVYIVALAGAFLLIILIFIVVRWRRQTLKLQHEVESKKLAAKSLIVGQEKERKRISENLHDGTALMLSLLVQEMSVKMTNYDEETQNYLNSFLDKLDLEISKVRRLSHEIYPSALKLGGLMKTLKYFLEDVRKGQPNIQIKYTYPISKEEQRFDEEIESNLYYIIQELIQNTLKHAKAKTITIDISIVKNVLNLTYTDDGIGFNTIEESEGLGMNNINSRANAIGTDALITSSKGSGMKVEIVTKTKTQS